MSAMDGGPYSSHWTTHSHQSPPISGATSPVAGPGGPSGRYGAQGYPSPPQSPGAQSTASGRVGCLTVVRTTALAKCSRYFRRLVHVGHMDFELAGWQMVYLLVKPQHVYRNFMYRKRTKDQYARDDPAFLVLLAAALLISTVIFTVALGLSFGAFVSFFLWVVLVDLIGMGVIIASALWLFANNFLRKVKAPDQDVEWAYCFDIHLNACFPFLVLMHIVMPCLYTMIIEPTGLFGRFIGNSLWFLAAAYYLYITFLGYTAIPNLRSTHVFLYPFSFLFIFYVATVTFGWNISQSVVDFYLYRVN